jgi:5,10-methylenetetrahydrofolate reductase
MLPLPKKVRMNTSPPDSLSFLEASAALRDHAQLEPFQVDIEAVKIRFQNGEEVIITQSFSQQEKYDLWLSEYDPYKPNQIVSSLSAPEADAWLKAISYRILKA